MSTPRLGDLTKASEMLTVVALLTDRSRSKPIHRCDYFVTMWRSYVTHIAHLRHNQFMEIDALNDHELGDSMLEEIRRTAERRLHEIEPLLEEAERLRDILDVIEGRFLEQSGTTVDKELTSDRELTRPASNGPRLRKSRQSRRQPTARPRSHSGERAAKGSNKRAILALVAEKPGITAAEISTMTGMKRTVVASTVSRLKRYGELIEHETGGVCVPSTPRTSAEPSNVATVSSRRASARSRRQPLSAVQARQAA